MIGRLGDLLVMKSLISTEQLEKALAEQRNNGGRLGQTLVKLGFLVENELISFLCNQYNVPSLNLSEVEIDPEVIKLVPADIAQKYQIVPVSKTGSSLVVAMEDPSNVFAIDDIKFLTGLNIEVAVTSNTAIRNAIDKYYDSYSSLDDVMSDFDDDGVEYIRGDEDVDVNQLERATEDAPVVKLVNLILTDAIKKEASDIHVEP